MELTDLTASGIAKAVNILTAIRWIKQAWESVTSKTIISCFKHCKTAEVPEVDGEQDLFADLDSEDEDMQANLCYRNWCPRLTLLFQLKIMYQQMMTLIPVLMMLMNGGKNCAPWFVRSLPPSKEKFN